MRSSDGHHWIALDHLRGVAAFLVFSWHFLHARSAPTFTFSQAPAIFPLALLDEGHVGVALFMTLSGYLFAKLLDGKEIYWSRFFWNRFVRLAPLLIVVMIAYGIVEKCEHPDFSLWWYFSRDILRGFWGPSWPNGGWSLTVETHFYLLLPIIVLLMRRWRWVPMMSLLGAIAFRAALFRHYGTIQHFAYYTIVGRFDQFLLGITAFRHRGFITGRHYFAGAVALSFMAFYWWFDWAGGYANLGGKLPSPSPLWIIIPTIEGAAFACIVAYYDCSFKLPSAGFSKLLGLVGTYSYSIYLLHAFVVFYFPKFIQMHVISISNFYIACAASLVCFCLMACVARASYTFIEKPFLRLRVRYTKPAPKPLTQIANA